MRSWLFNGIHSFAIDPRRRLGRHGHARRLLAGDGQSAGAASGAVRELASALQRHTVHSGLAQLSAEERRVITLAYLQGRTNSQIAAILGVSVSTVRRRLRMALEHLDDYARRAGTWVSSMLLTGLAYSVERAARFGRAANAVGASDWSHRFAAAVAAGAVTAAALSFVIASPDSLPARTHSRPPATALALPRFSNIRVPALAGQLPPEPDAATQPSVLPVVAAGDADHRKQVAKATVAVAAVVAPSTKGCHGNPTNAPPLVPVGPRPGHATSPPVTHPGPGGCRV
ncbi:MAG: sigma-70 family RNA polymerase sigma factor [Candidatus Dormiibacterota bacterium]